MGSLVMGGCTNDTRRAVAVDLDHLARYTMADPDLEAEILALFAAQAPQTIDRLRSAHSERQWREAAHTLKGSARAIGAWRLAEAAEDGEKVAGWQDQALSVQVLARVEAAFAEVRAFIAVPGHGRAPTRTLSLRQTLA